MPPVVNFALSILIMNRRNSGQFAYKTNIGKVRMINEDQAIALSNSSGDILLLVCDGMGGHNKGDYASKFAVDTISDAFRKKNHFGSLFMTKYWFSKVIRNTNLQIYNEAYRNSAYKDMGTTMVAALIIRDKIVIANIGDSRAYEVKFDGLAQLTTDQTYVDYLYRTGKITKEEMESHPKRHVLMNALGIYPSINLDVNVLPYLGNSILLCSDGLYNNMDQKEVFTILQSDDRIAQKVDMLIRTANENGGSDNIAIAYWESNHD